VLVHQIRDGQASSIGSISLRDQVAFDGASLGQTSIRDASKKLPIGTTGRRAAAFAGAVALEAAGWG